MGRGTQRGYTEIAAELVRLKVDVIVTSGPPAVVAVKQATSVIPIIFAATGDPVVEGFVASLARPGGNVTGLSVQGPDVAGKRVELLREIVPGLRQLAILVVSNHGLPKEAREVESAVGTLGLEATTFHIRRAEDIAPAFDTIKGHAQAVYVVQGPFVGANRHRINTLALGAGMPTVHANRENVEVGGLMSYGPNFPDLFRRAGDYVDKILRGAKPADLPVEQPIKFDLVINLITAKRSALPCRRCYSRAPTR
jgi:putative ABC transport system substrate-binding protein